MALPRLQAVNMLVKAGADLTAEDRVAMEGQQGVADMLASAGIDLVRWREGTLPTWC